MTVTEDDRRNLRDRAAESFGEKAAATLMESLPPVRWQDLATKEDLNTLSVVIGAEFTKVAAEFTKVAAEFTAVAAEFTAVRGEVAEQIGEVHKEIGALHVAVSESSQKTSDKLDSMRRWVVGSVVAVVGAVVGSGIWFG